MSKTDDISELFSKIIDTINDEKLNEKKDKIMEWIREDGNRNNQITDQTNLSTEISQTVHVFSTIIDPIKYSKLEGKTDKIMEWIKANEAHIHELDRKGFMNEISTYCNDKKLKGPLGKVWKEYTQYITDHPLQKQNESTPTAQLLSDIIRSLNDPKLEGKKDQIMEWIQTNGARIPQLNRKGFIDAISAHCGDKKIKGSLGKVWKQYEENMKQKEEQKYENEQDTDMKSSEMGRTAAMPEENGSESGESDESKSCYAHGDQPLQATEQMPTYIHRAIWFRSDDETLERLVDKAVKFVCKSSLWDDPEWIGNLYDAKRFEQNVESIGNNFLFFEAFVRLTFRRKMLLEALRQEKRTEPQDDNTEETATDSTTRHYRSKYILHEPPEEEDTDDLPLCQVKSADSEYHVYATDSVNLMDRTVASPDDTQKDFHVNASMDPKFKWVVWIRNKSKKTSKGYWKVLTHEANGPKGGVPIPHLNVLFELLRLYYHDKIKRGRDLDKLWEETGSIRADHHQNLHVRAQFDILYDTYCVEHHGPHKKDVHIKLFDANYTDKSKPAAHYVLTWWNCKKRTDCFAIAIKIRDSETPNRKMYYMRLNMSDLKHGKKPIEWFWYDNNNNKYQTFPDYENDPDKEGLLHMQMEATYQSNLYSNFPWKWFKAFNNAQLTHLKNVLKAKRGTAASVYLMRFTRLVFGQDDVSEEDIRKEKRLKIKHQRQRSSMLDLDFLRHQTSLAPRSVHIILSMEQVAISETAYPRNLKRLVDGKNALKAQYSGSDSFIEDWLHKYQLATESQQKYFWSFILSIATKIKLMDIEIENQLVTIPIREHVTHKHDLFSNGAEVAQEQQDALLYKGFLVPPVLGEAIADTIENDANASIEKIRESIENRSKTRVLKKSKVKEQGLINYDEVDEDFVYVHEVGDEQFLEHEANMFRFAEIVRKFIIESKHLKNDSSLWPYYRNNSHIEDYDIYHTLVNRFNLSFMFTKQNIFELFETESDETSIGCVRHFSCNDSDPNKPKDESQEIDEVAIRHRRKYAATLLLQRWNTLRNLNVLRQQLIVIFNHFHDEDSAQTEMVKKANNLTKKTWKEDIKKINKELDTNIKRNKSGWLFLSEYGNLKDNNPIEISVKQYPFFESFCAHFLFEEVKEDRQKLIDPRENQWFREFKQSWSAIPQWWGPKHDLLLLELALKYNINHVKFIDDLRGEKAFDFRMRLKDRTNYLEFTHFCAQSSNILHRLAYITHILVDEMTSIEPSLVAIRVPRNQRKEYNARDESFIFSDYDKVTHLQYVERKLDEIETYKPASKQTKGEDPKEYEKYRDILGPVVADLALTIRKEWPIAKKEESKEEKEEHPSSRKEKKKKRKKKKTKQSHIEMQMHPESSPLIQTDTSMQSVIDAYTTDRTDTMVQAEEEEEEVKIDPTQRRKQTDEEEEDPDAKEEEPAPKKKKKKIKVDPFISRDLEIELAEVINAFDMIKYGQYMARFVINEINELGMDELWIILGVVMEAIPFQMAQDILYKEMQTLERGTQEQLKTLCLKMVNGTNWRISSALRMAEYFKDIAEDDVLHTAEWMQISSDFENMAHDAVHDIESEHLLHLLLTIPLYDTAAPMNIIKLALEQKRISFLNNERILSIIKHIWYHGASFDIGQELKPDSLSFADLLPILCFTPLKFYILPVGYNFTLNMLFGMYLVYVLWYSFEVVNDRATPYTDAVLWILAIGVVLYEIMEWIDKRREYCSVSGLSNVFDIMISVCWALIFVINLMINPNGYSHRQSMVEEDTREILLKVYTLLFGFQIFLLTTRFLTLFQNTQYLGGLLKIVQRMFTEIVKFGTVACVVIAAFVFGFYFIYGLENIAEEDAETETPVGFWETILFSFELFVGGGTNDESYVGAVFTIFLTVFGALILTNLLIALMTTKYENFQETAQKEVHFMKIESVIDLAYRDRLMPPPLNAIVLPLGIIIHLFLTLCALLGCNCYSHINRSWYLFLDTCYCGCNRSMRRFYAKRNEISDEQRKEDHMIQQQLYDKLNCCSLCMQVSGLSYCWRPVFNLFYKCVKSCRKCWHQEPGTSKENTNAKAGCCCKCGEQLYANLKSKQKKRQQSRPLTAYHKGCYNCIKLKVKDELDDANENKSIITVRGITMKDYISKYEQEHGVKLHLADTILLKHLTADTLFCNYCYQPYLEDQVDKELLPPFRVLTDIISCFAFLITAWIPLILFFCLMAIVERFARCFDVSITRNKSHHRNKYEEFDREYFPHPEAQFVPLD